VILCYSSEIEKRRALITEMSHFTTLVRRKNSIPLMQELTAELMNRQKTGITTALLNSRASFQDNELKQHVYKKTLQGQCQIHYSQRQVKCSPSRTFQMHNVNRFYFVLHLQNNESVVS
jgi:hypothetical protein